MARLLIALAAIGGALLYGQKTGALQLQGGSGPPRPVWKAEEIRIAACAAWSNEIWTAEQIAEAIGATVYPEHTWPPPEGSSAFMRRFWRRILTYAGKVVEDPTICAGEGA